MDGCNGARNTDLIDAAARLRRVDLLTRTRVLIAGVAYVAGLGWIWRKKSCNTRRNYRETIPTDPVILCLLERLAFVISDLVSEFSELRCIAIAQVNKR